MNREEIMKILPHRDNMLLLDDVENDNGMAIGHYTIRGDEFFLKGHFPDRPIVPGVILCEIMAQSACVLMKDVIHEGQIPVYTGLNNVKFRSPVKPGDTVETQCKIKRIKHPFYFAEGKIYVNEKVCVTAEFSF
ncbi:MAG: 3-hydroxyacyl-ACP dehydratase FabZ family protein, partial [Eubacterium sp.]